MCLCVSVCGFVFVSVSVLEVWETERVIILMYLVMLDSLKINECVCVLM